MENFVKCGRRPAPVHLGLLTPAGYHTCMKDEAVYVFFPGSDLPLVYVVCKLPRRVQRLVEYVPPSGEENLGVLVKLRFYDSRVRFNRVYDYNGEADILPLYFCSFVRE